MPLQRGTSLQPSKHKKIITFLQRRPNVFDVGPSFYKLYTNLLYLLYMPICTYFVCMSHDIRVDSSESVTGDDARLAVNTKVKKTKTAALPQNQPNIQVNNLITPKINLLRLKFKMAALLGTNCSHICLINPAHLALRQCRGKCLKTYFCVYCQ